MKTPVDLGQSGPECCLSSPCEPPSKGEKYYPSLYISDVPEGTLELPDEGTMTVKFRVRRETDDKKNGKCSYDVEVLSIEDVSGTNRPATKDAGSALDEIASMLRKAQDQLLPQDVAPIQLSERSNGYTDGEME